MRLLVTGAHGTVGTALSAAAVQQGHSVIAWDRHAADPLALHTHADWVASIAPDAIVHLATAATPTGAENEGWRINVEWSQRLAEIAAERRIPLIYTSTALVFDNSQSGPFTLAFPSNAREGYGFEKRVSEHAILLRHPEGARVVRLGWQIGPHAAGNNMVAHVQREMQAHGHVRASCRWFPACSFLEDTAAALLRLLDAPPGLYMIDSNRGHSFDQILRALSDQFSFGWQVEANEDYIYDQRLIDPRLGLPALGERLPALRQS